MKGIVTHRIAIGDSLQKLARLYDVEDWREIALINQLESPYIDSVFQSREHINNDSVAKVGDAILIPRRNRETVALDDITEAERSTYGIDIDLYQGEAVRTQKEGYPTETGRDIRLTAGLENLSQQLKIRLGTKQGALLLHPNFGSRLHLYSGKLDKPETRNKVLFEIERCLRSDFRVDAVSDLEIQVVDGNYYVTGKVYPIEPGQPFELQYYIE